MDSKTLEEINKQLRVQMDRQNSQPRPESDNLSAAQMHLLFNFTFEQHSPLQWNKNITDDSLDKIPFLNSVEQFLKILNEKKEIKFTSIGNMPVWLCKELYEHSTMKDYMIEKGISKLSKEGDTILLMNIKIISKLAGLIKIRNKKASLTKKGLLLLKDRVELLKLIFTVNMKEFNLGYHDGYSQELRIQHTCPFTIYLLHKYGKADRPYQFYADKHLKAFPFELENFKDRYITKEEGYSNALHTRVFYRFLRLYGFIEIGENVTKDRDCDVKVTDAFYGVFGVE